jgi:hypothetical protein
MLLKQAYQASSNNELENLSAEAFAASGIKEGDMLDEKALRRLSMQAAIRLVHFMRKTPLTEPLMDPSEKPSD